MGRPSKPMARNSNSKFTTRNNKQEIFARIAKSSKPNAQREKEKRTMDASEPGADNSES